MCKMPDLHEEGRAGPEELFVFCLNFPWLKV